MTEVAARVADAGFPRSFGDEDGLKCFRNVTAFGDECLEAGVGFADIVPPGDIARFTSALEQAVADFQNRPEEWAQARFDQMQVINRECTWAVRAREWEEYLARELRG